MIWDFAWLIPGFPFLAFAAILLFTQRHARLSHALAIGSVAVAFALSQTVFWLALTGEVDTFAVSSVPWFTVGGAIVYLGLNLDPPALVMLFMVPLVCLMIFIYSIGYMQGDSRYGRFFAYISLFASAMLGLVLFDNLLAFFVCWEVMGLCSYLLIGFWHERPKASAAGLKAFLVTKVGDLFLFLGLVLLYSVADSLSYQVLFSSETLARLVGSRFLGLPVTPASLIAMLLFGGTIGKSAQFPLHTWLPDAMAGPTPVSALIHAATMVSAGVFLVVRMYPLFTIAGAPMSLLASVGTITALLGAVVALGQNDIKRVLAFSTMSQLGYMIAALGLGAYAAGFFHLLTHAFFKALLFLSAGSVIHGMEHGVHHGDHGDVDPNDLLSMGGLRHAMPGTYAAFLVGGLSLAGFPLVTAGFWSKDEILVQAYARNPVVFWGLALAALLTAFYTARQLSLIFLGEPRSRAAAHARESPRTMTAPLFILAAFALVLGWVAIPEHFPVLGGLVPNWFDGFVAYSHIAPSLSTTSTWQPMVMGTGAGLLGLGLGWLVYGWRPLGENAPDRLEFALGRAHMVWLHEALRKGFNFDRFYQLTIVRPTVALAAFSAQFDSMVIDGSVKGVGGLVRSLGALLAHFDGRVLNVFVDMWATVARGLGRVLNWLDLHLVDPVINVAGWLGQLGPWATGLVEPEVADAPVGPFARFFALAGGLFSALQTGDVQYYLGLAFFALIVLMAAFLS